MVDRNIGSESSSEKNELVEPRTSTDVPVGIPIASSRIVPRESLKVSLPSTIRVKKSRKTKNETEVSGVSPLVKPKKKPSTKVVRSIPPYEKGVPIRSQPGNGVRSNRVKIEVQYPRYYFKGTDSLLTHFLDMQTILWPENGILPRSLSRPPSPKSYAVADANSILILEDLARIDIVFRIGSEFVMSSCGSKVRANDPCRSNQILIFDGQLVTGMRFPLLPFFVEVLMEFNLAPAQIGANGWRTMVAFYSECRGKGLRPTGLVFRQLFKPTLTPTSEFVSWKHGRFNYLGGQPEKVPEGRHRFFLLSAKGENEHFPFPTNWNPRPDDPRT
ncbi:hypothetical protein M5689_012735 [Euphorbia peplus]|nr:hypothetical protein M5689_012735 [Euphorbia peplus]